MTDETERLARRVASQMLETAAMHYALVLSADWPEAEATAQTLAESAALCADAAQLMAGIHD